MGRGCPYSVGLQMPPTDSGSCEMSEWSEQPKEIGAVTLFVDDLGASKQFYRDVFHLPVYFEDDNSAVFQFGGVLINLLDVAEAGTLIAPAPVGTSGAGARSQFTIHVRDVDAVCATLTERGVALLNGPMNRPWGIRAAAFADPSGHIWEIAQELS
jgi:lactoylglutathione lyase